MNRTLCKTSKLMEKKLCKTSKYMDKKLWKTINQMKKTLNKANKKKVISIRMSLKFCLNQLIQRWRLASLIINTY